MRVTPVTLTGRWIRLEPLSMEHWPALCEIGLDPAIWKLAPNLVRTPEDLRRYVEVALEAFARGVALPFATFDKASGRVIGSTRFAAIEVVHRRVEIGWTWLSPAWQRTAANTEAKWLMLSHAFETWACMRVELKTDALNEVSRNAIRRLGAREEGIFRKYIVTHSGRVRDTVWYSILDTEWPAVKAGLEEKLRR